MIKRKRKVSDNTLRNSLVVAYALGIVIGVTLVKLGTFDWLVKPPALVSEASELPFASQQASSFQNASPGLLPMTCPLLFEAENGICVPIIKR